MLRAAAAGFMIGYCEVDIALIGANEISATLDLTSAATFLYLHQDV
jgi:hypothetical protein